VWKDKKAFTADMKHIYNAPNKELVRAELERFAGNWNSKFPLPYNLGKETGRSSPYFLTSL